MKMTHLIYVIVRSVVDLYDSFCLFCICCALLSHPPIVLLGCGL